MINVIDGPEDGCVALDGCYDASRLHSHRLGRIILIYKYIDMYHRGTFIIDWFLKRNNRQVFITYCWSKLVILVLWVIYYGQDVDLKTPKWITESLFTEFNISEIKLWTFVISGFGIPDLNRWSQGSGVINTYIMNSLFRSADK